MSKPEEHEEYVSHCFFQPGSPKPSLSFQLVAGEIGIVLEQQCSIVSVFLRLGCGPDPRSQIGVNDLHHYLSSPSATKWDIRRCASAPASELNATSPQIRRCNTISMLPTCGTRISVRRLISFTVPPSGEAASHSLSSLTSRFQCSGKSRWCLEDCACGNYPPPSGNSQKKQWSQPFQAFTKPKRGILTTTPCNLSLSGAITPLVIFPARTTQHFFRVAGRVQSVKVWSLEPRKTIWHGPWL